MLWVLAVVGAVAAVAGIAYEMCIRDSSNIPYKIIGGMNFYARKEIKDILAYLKTIENGRDDLAIRRIINVPKRGIGATTLLRVQEYAQEKGMSFYDALRYACLLYTSSLLRESLTSLPVFI